MPKQEKPAKPDYGINIRRLKEWQDEQNSVLMSHEESMQEIALAKVRTFMLAIGTRHDHNNFSHDRHDHDTFFLM
jgi:hypothetical protein